MSLYVEGCRTRWSALNNKQTEQENQEVMELIIRVKAGVDVLYFSYCPKNPIIIMVIILCSVQCTAGSAHGPRLVEVSLLICAHFDLKNKTKTKKEASPTKPDMKAHNKGLNNSSFVLGNNNNPHSFC